MTDQEGELLWSAHYKAWGEAKVQRSERAKHLRIDNYHRYQGQYYDNETGLHYNRFRYYDPEQYIAQEHVTSAVTLSKYKVYFVRSARLNGGMNLNAYVPNPNLYIDPLGLQYNFGSMVGIESQAAQSSIASEGYRQYDCWLKTGNRCVINIEPLFDYAVCQRGNRVEVYNFHNGNIYTGHSGSLFEHKGKPKLGDIATKSNNSKYKIGSSSLDKVKDMFNASCAVDYIMNKDLRRYKIDQAVDNFVTGMGVNITANYKFITLGITKPANSDLLELKAPTAIEVGLSTTRSGISANAGYTFDQKLIKTQ